MSIKSFYQILGLLLLALLSRSVIANTINVGPIVGAVTSSSARVTVRTTVPANVFVEYDTDPFFSSPSISPSVNTFFNRDLTATMPLEGLLADTKYYYRIRVNNVIVTPQQLSFSSFPLEGLNRPFSFVAMADVGNDRKRPAPTYIRAALDRPRFMIQIGDWDHRDPQTLAEMRIMHREVVSEAMASGRDFKNYMASTTPLFHVWDDHDYGMENGDYTFPAKADALRAFQEYYPTPDLPNPSAGIWHSFKYAQAEIFMLDVRSNRDPNDVVDGPDKSILNGENIENGQKEWLFNGLLNSTAHWKFIVSGSNFNPTCKPSDSWGAFATEQQELVNFIKDNNISNVIVLSGDLHSGGGFDDGTNSGLPELSVPNTNMNVNPNTVYGVTTTQPGLWTGGLDSGVGNSGYLQVEVKTQPHRLVLNVKRDDGVIRKSFTIDSQ